MICILHIGVYGTARRLEEMHCIVMCTGTLNIIHVANMSRVHENSFSTVWMEGPALHNGHVARPVFINVFNYTK